MVVLAKLSKKKAPSREKHPMKEYEGVDAGVFNTKTMMFLGKFFNKMIVNRLDFIIATGKEADVYVADPGASDAVSGMDKVVLKFFRIETSSFFKMADYMIGDPRFTKIGRSKQSIVYEWCKKEYGNLKVAEAAGVPVPKPIMFNGSILAMSMIGEDAAPAPQLRNVALEEPEKTLDAILLDIRKMYKSNLVHGDMSEFNILVHKGQHYFIDFGQAVFIKHPNSMVFLRRDVDNILKYFKKTYGISRGLDEALTMVTTT